MSSRVKHVPICEKLNLTVEEAAAYTGLGTGILRFLLKQPNCPFSLRITDKKVLIRRRQLEEYLASRNDFSEEYKRFSNEEK